MDARNPKPLTKTTVKANARPARTATPSMDEVAARNPKPLTKTTVKANARPARTATPSMDEVAASFAASLALATNEVVDLSRSANSAERRGKQSYLLARPLAAKPAPLQDLRRFFRRVWVLDRDFKIQERGENRFVIAFDLKRDRNKVLRGGPWRFNQAPVVMQEYDGIAPPHLVALTALFFWVRITGIPPLFEDKETIRDITASAGKVMELDDKLFDNTGKIRVRVSRELSKPFDLRKKVKLAPGVEAEINFFFENLVGKCNYCDLIFHEHGVCPAADGRALPRMEPNLVQRKLDVTGPSLSFMQSRFENGMLKFHGLQTPILPSVARSLFHSKEHGGRKPVVLRGSDCRSASSRDEANTTLALVPVETVASTKRDWQSSDYRSPTKLKVLLPELFTSSGCNEAPSKKLKMPEFSSKFNAKSLGLIEAPGSILVPKSEADSSGTKKKRGRPLGSKNKKSLKPKNVAAAQEACLAFLTKPPSPSVNGKEKI